MVYSTNYFEQILNYGKPCRWNKHCVNVYIYKDTVYKYKQEEVLLKTKEAFEEWYKVLNGILKFDFVDDPDIADIFVSYQRNNSSGTIGMCYYTDIADNGAYQRMDICIGLVYSTWLLQNIMHEIGHALGLMGHSDVHSDLMYKSVSKDNLNLSLSDVNTIKLLYNTPLEGEEYSIFDKKNVVKSLNDSIINEVLNEQSLQEDYLLKKLDDISDLNKYNLSFQNIDLNIDYRIF